VKPAAVFDLDGTLIRGTSAERLLVPHLVRHGIVGVRQLTAALGVAATVVLVGRTRALRRNKRWLAGVEVAAVLETMEGFLDQVVSPRWCAGTVARMAELKERGVATFVLSGAPDFVVRAVGARLGADGVVGTPMEVRQGRFTGRLAGPHCFAEAKRDALMALAREHDLDLGSSWGFADHPSDVAFLECFGRAVVVGASARLRRVAEERGWAVAGCEAGVG